LRPDSQVEPVDEQVLSVYNNKKWQIEAIMNRYTKFDDKKILIWGYGREGKSTEAFLKNCCRPASIEVFEGKPAELDESGYDYIIKSPGIPVEEASEKLTSQTDIFLECFRDRVIGVTGTKGKSTTSSLLYTALRECSGKNVILLGNIGRPCLDYFEEIDTDTIVVFEMSCHQLAHAVVSPHVAVFLNLFEEHLDYYHTLDKYFTAKSHVAAYQTEEDFFYVGENVPDFPTKAKKTVISAKKIANYSLQIPGAHNDYNAEFVYRICTELFACDGEAVKKALSAFTGLPHRLQNIGTLDGVTYIDDSISTIPNATIEASKAVKNAYSIIIGGMDRGIDYETLIDYIKEHSEFYYICAYASGKRIYDAVGERSYITYVEDLEAAVAVAKRVTPAGKACVLSPAAASYGYFNNFEHRGEMFKQYVGL